MNLQSIPTSGNNVTPTNENFATLDWAAVYGMAPQTQNLDWVFVGGMWAGFTVAGGVPNKLVLTDNVINYNVVRRVDGVNMLGTLGNWDDSGQYRRAYRITTSGGLITLIEDFRAGPGGVHAGIAKPEPVVNRAMSSPTDNLVIGDAENCVTHNDTVAGTLTIPTNATVAFPIGTSIALLQDNTGQLIIAAAGGVTLNVEASLQTRLAARYAMAMLFKRDTDRWILSGSLEKV